MPLEVAMLKYVLAGTTALAIAGASIAYAQQPAAQGPGPRAQWKAEDIAAFGDARIAALKAGLKLTAEQEKNWPAVESALRDLAKQRADRFAARANTGASQQPTDPIERLAQRAQHMEQGGSALKKLADAAGPLYKSLDDGQKRRFAMLAKVGARDGAGWHRGRHEQGERHGWRHHGPRGPERGGPMGPAGPMGPEGGRPPR
jgi:hypothetical protein